mgnify:CR=1 FL=1
MFEIELIRDSFKLSKIKLHSPGLDEEVKDKPSFTTALILY